MSKTIQTTVIQYINDPSAENVEKVVHECEPLVHKCILKMNTREDYDDLLQVGRLAIVQALSKYDCTKNTQFSTHAMHWIMGKLRNHVRSFGSPIATTTWLNDFQSAINNATAKVKAKGLQINPETLANESKYSASRIEYVLSEYANVGRVTNSLDTDIVGDDGTYELRHPNLQANVYGDNKKELSPELELFYETLNDRADGKGITHMKNKYGISITKAIELVRELDRYLLEKSA